MRVSRLRVVLLSYGGLVRGRIYAYRYTYPICNNTNPRGCSNHYSNRIFKALFLLLGLWPKGFSRGP